MKRQLKLKKAKTKAAYLYVALLITAAATLSACGSSVVEEERSLILEDADMRDMQPKPDAVPETEMRSETDTDTQPKQKVQEESILSEDGDSKEYAKLSGIVVSINGDSIVVNETQTAESDGVLFAGSSGEDITVYFSEDAEFVFETVKNSGVNGAADVESREGSFADIRENIFIEMTGVYQGGDFLAKHVTISDFI